MGTSTFTARSQASERKLPGILALLALLLGTIGFLLPYQVEAHGQLSDQRCKGAFQGDPPGSLAKTVEAKNRGELSDGGLVLPGESITVTVTWETSEWNSLDVVADCVEVDGQLRVDLSADEKPTDNDGVWKHSFEIPEDLEAGSEVCDRARLSGQPSGEVTEGGQPVSTQKSNVVCLEVVDQLPTGDVGLSKDATGDAPQGATFTFSVDCDGTDFDATGIELGDGGTVTVVDDAPTGTVCTIEETGKAGADTTTFSVDGVDQGETDSVTVTVGDGTTVAVVATNDFQQPSTGDVGLSKDATGDVPEGATFTFSVDCEGTDFDATGIELGDGGTVTVVDDAPTGTVCTIEETGKAGADTTTFSVDGVDQGETDSVTVTVGDGTTVAVAATNDFDQQPPPPPPAPETFSLDLLKVDEGNPSNLLAGAQFSLFSDVGTTSGVLDDADTFEGACTTGSDGQCEFDGLAAGDYLLVEIRAPEGFVAASDDPIGVTIVDADESVTVENQPVDVGGVVAERADIELVKTADPVIAEVGDTVTYTYEITNTGETRLSDLVLVDDKLGIILLPDVVLEPGDSIEVEQTHVVTQADADAGTIVNVAVVTGQPPVGPSVSDDARAEVAVVQVAGVVVTRPAPDAPEERPAPDAGAEQLARTGARTAWLLLIAVIAMAAGVAFLRASDRVLESRS